MLASVKGFVSRCVVWWVEMYRASENKKLSWWGATRVVLCAMIDAAKFPYLGVFSLSWFQLPGNGPEWSLKYAIGAVWPEPSLYMDHGLVVQMDCEKCLRKVLWHISYHGTSSRACEIALASAPTSWLSIVNTRFPFAYVLWRDWMYWKSDASFPSPRKLHNASKYLAKTCKIDAEKGIHDRCQEICFCKKISKMGGHNLQSCPLLRLQSYGRPKRVSTVFADASFTRCAWTQRTRSSTSLEISRMSQR